MTVLMENMKQMNVKITTTQYEKLTQLSKAYGGISKSNLVRIAVSEYIYNHQYLITKIKK